MRTERGPASRVGPLDHGGAALLVTGSPAAGKSTVARAVAGALSRSALVHGDAVARLVVGGYVWPLGEPADEAARQVELCNDNVCALAGNLLANRFTPVIDWIVPDGDQLEVYRTALGDRLRFVVLDPGADVCAARDRQRAPLEQFAFDGHDALRATMVEGFGRLGWWLDSSDLTAEETAGLVLREAHERARV